MSSIWIFDRRYGYYAARFGGTAKVLQSYFAVAFIVIWLCTASAMLGFVYVMILYLNLIFTFLHSLYAMLQHTLAKLYIDILGLAKGSVDAQKLLNFRAPTAKQV